jgi:hypothetical protein
MMEAASTSEMLVNFYQTTLYSDFTTAERIDLNKVAVPCESDSGSNLSVLSTMNDGNEIKYLLIGGSILIF